MMLLMTMTKIKVIMKTAEIIAIMSMMASIPTINMGKIMSVTKTMATMRMITKRMEVTILVTIITIMVGIT